MTKMNRGSWDHISVTTEHPSHHTLPFRKNRKIKLFKSGEATDPFSNLVRTIIPYSCMFPFL